MLPFPRRKFTSLNIGDDTMENSTTRDSDGYDYLQEQLKTSRESESSPSACDISEVTSAFDRPLSFHDSLYGDDMVKDLPALVDRCVNIWRALRWA